MHTAKEKGMHRRHKVRGHSGAGTLLLVLQCWLLRTFGAVKWHSNDKLQLLMGSGSTQTQHVSGVVLLGQYFSVLGMQLKV